MIYLVLFLEFFKVGLFTFGGGYAMIPLIEEITVSYGWITESEFYDFIGVCESTPGPIAVNMATYIGATQGGILGSICATLGVVTPSFLIILLIASILKNFTQNKYVQAFLKGVKPVVVALIVATGVILLAKCVGYQSPLAFDFDWRSTMIFSVLTLMYFLVKKIWKKKIPTALFILLSAVLGILICAL